jgi:predicted transcriptional regulator
MNLKGSQGKFHFALKHPLRCCIVDLLRANGALNSSELSNLLSISLVRCVYHLDNLNFLIKKDKKQRYLLTNEGMRAHKLLLGQKSLKSKSFITAFSDNNKNESVCTKRIFLKLANQ